MKTKRTVRDLHETFDGASPSFKAHVTALAARCGKSPLTVFGWWLEYCEACSCFDQSPVLGEFELWNAARLVA